MSFIYKNNISLSIFGASHNEYMGITIDGIKHGQSFDLDEIKQDINRRKPQKNVGTTRIEDDDFEIISGLINNYTTGDSITVLVKNKNINSKEYNYLIPRPGHSDYPSYVKSEGCYDYRGGGKSSGRLTLLLVIVGSMCKQILRQDSKIEIFSQVKNIGSIYDDKIENFDKNLIKCLQEQNSPCLNLEKKEKMVKKINDARLNNDSIGGSINCYAKNVEVGIGNPYFDSFESVFSHLMYSVGAVKAVSFGKGFEFGELLGSQCLDEMYVDKYKDIKFYANNNGGLLGGMTSGNIIEANIVFKPTPSIYKKLRSVHMENFTNEISYVKGRHDPCIAFRCPVVCEAIMALTIMDLS